MKFTASALVLSAFVSSAFALSCTREYTVKEGDYCDAISAAQNVSTYQLAVVNKDIINEACSNLAIGQKLCLGYETQDCTTTYLVEEGDYCDLISSKFGINTTLLYTNNPQIDDNCYNLYIDEVLCVANTELVTPPPEGFVLPGSTLESDDTYDDSTASSDTVDTDPPVDDSVITSTTAAVATTTKTSTTTAAATTTPPKAAVNNAAEDDGDDEGDDDECED